MTSFVKGIEQVAAESNLTVPAVRYWAETRGDALGIRRDALGEWHFSPEAAAFLRELGRLQSNRAPGPGAKQKTPSKPAVQQQLAALGASLAELEERHRDLALQGAHLAEEMRQVQLLLSRVMELMSPPTPPGGRPRVVRPWRPRRL